MKQLISLPRPAQHQKRFLEEYLWLPFKEFASTLSKKRWESLWFLW